MCSATRVDSFKDYLGLFSFFSLISLNSILPSPTDTRNIEELGEVLVCCQTWLVDHLQKQQSLFWLSSSDL